MALGERLTPTAARIGFLRVMLIEGIDVPEIARPNAADRVLVALATYQEAENIAKLVEEIHTFLPAADVLVTDDNSPDGTGILLDELSGNRPWLRVSHRPGKLGLGSALLAAARFAIEQNYAYWITMDGDFSHSPKYLPALTAGMVHYDVMIGSRYVPGGGISGWDWKRHWMSRCINVYTRLLLGLKVRDCSGGFRCYRIQTLCKLELSEVYSTGYSFMEEFLFHCKRAGARIGETPIHFENRIAGKSKLRPREMLTALWALFYVAVKYGRRRRFKASIETQKN